MSEERDRRLAAVWFADIVGYTALSEQNEDGALRLVAELQAAAEREVETRGGRVVKYVGDAALATFESAARAVEAALALRDAFHASPPARELKARLRIGVHVGEIFTAEDGDVFGDGVNTASRIQGAAAPGQVLLSEFAVESIRHRTGYRAIPKGKRRFKGLSRPLALYAAGVDGAEDPFISLELPPGHASPISAGKAVGIGLVAGIAGLFGLGVALGAFGNQEEMGPQGEMVDGALALGIEAYYRGDMEEAEGELALFLEPAGTLSQRRQGLRYLARTEIMAGDTSGARKALEALLSTERPSRREGPRPLALLIPSLEDSVLMRLYYDARRNRIREEGRHDPSEAVRGLMVFDFQVFAPEMAMATDGLGADPGYLVAFMLQTELALAGLEAASVKEMSFQGRGDQAYVDMETTLAAMREDAPSHLLTGSVAINRTGILLSAWVYELKTGRLVVSEQVTGELEALLMSLPEEMASRITGALAVTEEPA